MSPAIVMEYIRFRAKELGLGEAYILRMKHFAIPPQQQLNLHTSKDFYVMIEMPEDLRVESDRGVYDLSELDQSEQEYEHRGTIQISNLFNFTNHLKMIQVIPD
ncbi:MAG TPA: hypothetical protein VJ552_05870 [Sediminibacterium sp.]|nr:hypothetical protein [Sediminibacterium sp.]